MGLIGEQVHWPERPQRDGTEGSRTDDIVLAPPIEQRLDKDACRGNTRRM